MMDIVFQLVYIEQLAIRIRQEMILMKGITNRVVFYPFSFFLFLRSTFLFINVISELVICHNERIEALGILDAVGIIIVLRRSLHYHT